MGIEQSASAAIRSPLAACLSELIKRFRTLSPHVALTENGYVADAIQNLVEGISLEDFEADLQQGGGDELRGKFRAVRSSSALAVNTFAPFKAHREDLLLPGGETFEELKFERKCPNGVSEFAPFLDLLVESQKGVVGVESKLLEPLSRHTAKFSPSYDKRIKDDRRQSGWFQEMQRLIEAPKAYQWLDAAQLVKHAFGIAHTFRGRPTTLLYLFWEPANPDAFPFFAEHRKEVAQFAAAIAGGGPTFVAMSYPELWRLWVAQTKAKWLTAHIGRLRARYEVVVPER